MSHLDTAYKLGAAAAWEDFQRMVQEKQGQTPPQPVTPAAGPAAKPVTPAPKFTPKPPGQTMPPAAPEGIVNPGPRAGLVNRGY
jgi:hypothetical protein